MTEELTAIENLNGAITLNEAFIQEAKEDFWTCCLSREASLLGRKEVLTGKAKFGIFGAGKEVPQVAMARAFRKGDWRSGYYRDQTVIFALGLMTLEEFFAQLYADPENDPYSGGRQMNAHFATPMIDEQGNWISQIDQYNTASDISCTGGQMARGLGLALASKKYRALDQLRTSTDFSNNGDEVCFVTIGDASTSEGVFWETVNAAAVQQVPLAISVWDDGYGISVPKEYQTAKGSISTILRGFEANEEEKGFDIHVVNGWDYAALRHAYQVGIENTRTNHCPTLFHVEELTQPQGHSTSGSHERYKDRERLDWEKDNDCIKRMAEWLVREGIYSEEEIAQIKKDTRKKVREGRDAAWAAYMNPVKENLKQIKALYQDILTTSSPERSNAVQKVIKDLERHTSPLQAEIVQSARRMQFVTLGEQSPAISQLYSFLEEASETADEQYHTHLYSQSEKSALLIPSIPARYSDASPKKSGYQILNAFFDKLFASRDDVFAFGEDVGQIGDVNQGFAGLQKTYGETRIFDTGIREWTIMGQAIGMAMRGLRPIAEIQYLDYLIYGLEPLSDDLATLRYRSDGIQQAPAIIRTRGHRLEGIWHSGSPMGMLINSLRGMYVLVPRNMTQAVGFYNSLLQSDDPAIVIECLNGYRLKEVMPDNIGEYTVPLGVPDILQVGTDVTLVTYGSCIRIAEEGIKLLERIGISVELIDVQSLLPFDRPHIISQSLKKTNRIVFMDEDVPGGATAFMQQQVLEVQGGYQYLDSTPVTLAAKAHRPPFGSDGDYYTKPNPEDVFEVIYQLMHEAEPQRFPAFLKAF